MVVAIVTCRQKPEPDPDEAPLVEALRARGSDVRVAAWDAPEVAWDEFSVAVLRSTWNYVFHLPEFLAWLDRAAQGTTILNPPSMVKWNLDKRYLREIASRGVPIVPTAWIARGEMVDVERLLEERGWDDVVVKPVVGAASFATRRFQRATVREAAAFLAEHTPKRDMMVQPYLRSVEGYGERSVMWIAGALTHAVRKSPRFGGEHESVSDAVPIAADERRVAAAALASLEDQLLYARVDLARDDAGLPVVMELELAEPSLYLAQSPVALARFADALIARATTSAPRSRRTSS